MSKRNRKTFKGLLRTVAIIPFSVIVHDMRFRYKKHWWKKKHGTQNFAYRIDLRDKTAHIGQSISGEEFVGALKNEVPVRNHFEIKKEIKI